MFSRRLVAAPQPNQRPQRGSYSMAQTGWNPCSARFFCACRGGRRVTICNLFCWHRWRMQGFLQRMTGRTIRGFFQMRRRETGGQTDAWESEVGAHWGDWKKGRKQAEREGVGGEGQGIPGGESYSISSKMWIGTEGGGWGVELLCDMTRSFSCKKV